DASPERLGAIPTGGSGDATSIEHAADLLVEADSPVLVVGDHVARAGADAVAAAVELAETSGARVHGEILLSEVDFPMDHEQWVSPIPPDEDLARTLLSADTVVFAGCSTNTTLTRHEGELVGDDTTCIHLSDAVHEIGKNQPADAAVVGDPGVVMGELATRLRERLDDETREERIETVRSMKEMVEGQIAAMGEGDAEDDPRASKAELVDALQETAPDAYIVDEGI